MLDADDVIAGPQVVRKLAARMGMDPSKVQHAWSPLDKEQVDQLHLPRSLCCQTLNSSHGLLAEKSAANMGYRH